MAPCKQQLKAIRHLVCESCSNWVDFVNSGCEKSWVEVQADSFECRGCAKMTGVEVEMERLKQFVLAMVGTLAREEVGCASGSSGGTVDNKEGEAMREMLWRAHLGLGGGKVTGQKETGHQEMGGKAMGVKETGRKAMKASGVKATGAQDSQEMGGKEYDGRDPTQELL